jgi:hypothetical protein
MFMRYMFRPHRAIFRQHTVKESSALCTLSIVLLKYIIFNGPNRVGVSHPSHEDGNRSSLRNVCYFVFSRIPDNGKIAKSQ